MPNRPTPPARSFEPSTDRWQPDRWTAEAGRPLVVALGSVRHPEPGQRLAHRHGVLWTARFTPSGAAAGLSDFAAFRGSDGIPCFVRLSSMLRTLGDRDIKGMAVKMVLPGGELTDFVAMSLDVFPVGKSRHFVALMDAIGGGPVWIAPRIAALILSRRVSAPALAAAAAAYRRGGDHRRTTFHGVQTFRLVRRGRDGGPAERRPMRYRWVPSGADGGDGARPARFRLELALGNPAWPWVDDPRRRWPRTTPTVDAGELVLDEIVAEPPELAFNPVVLAPGIEIGDDDLISGRAGAYAVAHVQRCTATPPGGGG